MNNLSSPSLSSQQRGSSPQIIAGASSGPTPTAPGLSCAEGSRAGRRTPRGVPPEQNRGAEPPPLPCCPHCWGCSSGYGWPSGLPAHIVGSCSVFHPDLFTVSLKHKGAGDSWKHQLEDISLLLTLKVLWKALLKKKGFLKWALNRI